MDFAATDLQETRIGSEDVHYFAVDRSADPDLSPPEGYRHIFFSLDRGISWSGIQAPKGNGHAGDVQVFGLTGYADHPLCLPWRAIAEYCREKNINAIFSIYAHHLVTPETRAATYELQPHATGLEDSAVFDRDGIRPGSARRGVRDYLRESLIGRDLHAHLTGDDPGARATYFVGHSIGGVAAVMETMRLAEEDDTAVAGCFTFGLVAGFAHTVDDSAQPDDKPGFLSKLMKMKNRTPGEDKGRTNQEIFEAERAFLALPEPASMWFNPEFVRQYQAWDLLKQDPAKIQRAAPFLTTVRGTRDGMAVAAHVVELHEKHHQPGMKLHEIQGAGHQFIEDCNSGLKGNRDVIPVLVELFGNDLHARRRAGVVQAPVQEAAVMGVA